MCTQWAQRVHACRESDIISSKRWCSVLYASALGISVKRRGPARLDVARGMPNGIANPIQETSGTNGGSMFYRYCSRRSVDVRLESAIRILRVLSAVCKRIYGLAFVYRRPCYDFPRRQLPFFFPTRTIRRRWRRALKWAIREKAEEARYTLCMLCRDSSSYLPSFLLSLTGWSISGKYIRDDTPER